ncbi:uncharacterized protein [Haliotis cracherodii]|uniref:uncharacterized protein isoform X2 n=1 Tax=Haliotis cracherodii TaxID=6455 RepID=UPI0039EB5DF0
MFIETLEFTIPVELCNVFSTLQKGQRSNVEFPASVNSYGTTQDASVQVVLRSNKLTFKVDGVSSNASMISKSECKTLKLSVFDVDRTLMPQENDNYDSNNMSAMQHSTPVSFPSKRHQEISVSQPPSKNRRTSFSESPRPRSPLHRRSQPQISPRPSPNTQSKSKNDSPVNVKQEPEDPDLIEIELDHDPDDVVPKKETPYMQIDYSSDVPHTQTSQAALDRLSHPQSSHSQSPGSSSSSFHQNVPHVPDYAEPSTSQVHHGDQSADDFLVFQEQDEDCDDNDADYGNDGCQVHFDTTSCDLPTHQSATLYDTSGDLSTGMLQRQMTVFEPKKRKLTVKSLETKFLALLEVEKGQQSKAQIAREFGVPPNTLSTWLKQADRIKTAYLECSFNPTRKRLRSVQYEDVDDATLQWYRNAILNDVPVSGRILLAKTQEIALQRGHVDFKASLGWLERFKCRHGITFGKGRGRHRQFKAMLEEYGPLDYTVSENRLVHEAVNAAETKDGGEAVDYTTGETKPEGDDAHGRIQDYDAVDYTMSETKDDHPDGQHDNLPETTHYSQDVQHDILSENKHYGQDGQQSSETRHSSQDGD